MHLRFLVMLRSTDMLVYDLLDEVDDLAQAREVIAQVK